METSPRRIASIVLILGLVVTAIATLVHGEAGTSQEIAARDSWKTIHIVQSIAFFTVAVGAMAFGMSPGVGGLLRTAMAFLAVGALLNGYAHVIDGPVRVDMHENGLGDGDPLYETMMSAGIWAIVPAYAFMGFGGALHAASEFAASTKARKAVAGVVTALFLLGSTAGWGSILLEVIPGVTFLALALGWLWTAFTLRTDVARDATHQRSPAPA